MSQNTYEDFYQHCDTPHNLTNILQSHTNTSEIIIGSSFFILRISGQSSWQVWSTPESCIFQFSEEELSPEALETLRHELPRFVNLFSPDATKVSPQSNWELHETTGTFPSGNMQIKDNNDFVHFTQQYS